MGWHTISPLNHGLAVDSGRRSTSNSRRSVLLFATVLRPDSSVRFSENLTDGLGEHRGTPLGLAKSGHARLH